MHIAEGFLPLNWSIAWYILSMPFVILGAYKIKKIVEEKPELKPLLAISIAFVFILSALKLPSVSGSCSHPTGTGLPIVLFGPVVTALISFIVLVFQALFLAHGGITTLGANVFAMGIIGPIIGWMAYRASKKIGASIITGSFIAAFTADIMTYVTTATQLGAAFPATEGGFSYSLQTFLGVFALTQIPLAIVEGVAVMTVVKYLREYNIDLFKSAKGIIHWEES